MKASVAKEIAPIIVASLVVTLAWLFFLYKADIPP